MDPYAPGQNDNVKILLEDAGGPGPTSSNNSQDKSNNSNSKQNTTTTQAPPSSQANAGGGGKEKGSKKKKLIGSTVTILTGDERKVQTPLGDKVRAALGTGVLAGDEGSLATKNVTTFNGEVTSVDLTVLNTTFSVDPVGKGVGTGLTFGKTSVYIGWSVSNGITFGTLRTNENHVVSMSEGSVRAGGGTLILAGTIYFVPEFLPTLGGYASRGLMTQ